MYYVDDDQSRLKATVRTVISWNQEKPFLKTKIETLKRYGEKQIVAVQSQSPIQNRGNMSEGCNRLKPSCSPLQCYTKSYPWSSVGVSEPPLCSVSTGGEWVLWARLWGVRGEIWRKLFCPVFFNSCLPLSWSFCVLHDGRANVQHEIIGNVFRSERWENAFQGNLYNQRATNTLPCVEVLVGGKSMLYHKRTACEREESATSSYRRQSTRLFCNLFDIYIWSVKGEPDWDQAINP